MKKGYMYILQCGDSSYYTGSTNNLEARLWQHQNQQGSNYTKKHQPVKLVYVEEFDRIDEAFGREKQIQGWNKKKKEALINGNFERLAVLSKSRASTSSATEITTSSVTEAKTSSATEIISAIEISQNDTTKPTELVEVKSIKSI
ncbi:MAG: hypothetical protein RL154_813 [Pseudomonadota bacterium]|jgi:putative endonuclease